MSGKPMTLAAQIVCLSDAHGGLRALSRAVGIDAGYLSRLAAGEKTEPGDEVLAKLGLRRVVTYEHIGRKRGNHG